MAARLLFVFAKEPRPGNVKTRLCPPLTPEQASRCQQAFLRDILERMNGAAGARLVLCGAPDGDAPGLETLARSCGVEFGWQGPGDLGKRMERALKRAYLEGAHGVIIGADSPDLPSQLIEAAFAAIEARRVVLGPSTDGGYYLIGCGGPVPSIFDHGPIWGGPEVFARTTERLRRCGIAHHVLPDWYDVDDIEGLRRLARRLTREADAQVATRLSATRAVLRALAREGVSL